MFKPLYYIIIFMACCHHAFAEPASDKNLPQCQNNNDDMLFRAEKIDYDLESKKYIASGNVEFFFQDKYLKADKVTYLQDSETGFAEGNIILYDRVTNTHLYADYLNLNKGLSVGLAKMVYLRKDKYLKVAAERVERKSDVITVLHNAAYTPCHFENNPLWQLRAKKIIDDDNSEDISYQDVQLEVLSYPVITLPRFTYPRPSVERRSGWLIPEVDFDTLDGASITTPYFFELSQDKTVSVSPRFYSEHLPLLQSEYKQRTNNGFYRVQTAMTSTNDDTAPQEFRGSIMSSARTFIDDHSGWGADFNRTTDDSFFARYDLGQPEYLQSRLFYDFDNGKTSLYAASYAFQNLDQVVDNDNVPYILPYIDYKHISSHKPYGGDLTFSGNIASTYRSEGIDTKRIISQIDWEKQYVIPQGILFSFQNQLRTDLYHTTGGSDPADSDIYIESGYTARFLPQSSFKFSLPLLKSEEESVQLIEPTVQAIVAPYNNNAGRIPNEDGFASEFDASGLYDLQRFYGYDLVEDGPRFNAGMRYLYQENKHGSLEAQIGQSFRLREDTRFAEHSGLGQEASDYVGRFVINYQDHISLTHRFRLDKSDGSVNMSDMAMTLSSDNHKLRINYFHLDSYSESSFFNNAEQLNIGLRNSLSDNWHIITGYSHNLPDSKTLETRAGLIYTDECFIAEFGVGREHIRFRDIEPHTSAYIRIKLLSLGNDGFIQ